MRAHTHTHKYTNTLRAEPCCSRSGKPLRLRHIRQPVSFNPTVSVFVPYFHLDLFAIFFFIFQFFFPYFFFPRHHNAVHNITELTTLMAAVTTTTPTNSIDQGYQPYFHYFPSRAIVMVPRFIFL